MVWQNIGLLLLRLTLGFMILVGHGWPKLVNFSSLMETFPDPLGVGPLVSLLVTVIAEVVGSFLLILGLGTKMASVLLTVVLSVAAFVVHGQGSWSAKELALLYALVSLCLLLVGPGQYSLDAKKHLL